jgi:glutathione synthase/RimK-type ligase-like ATP-grasp enzyme
MAKPSVALATCEQPPVPDKDAGLLIPALAERGVEAALVPWSDPDARWEDHDLVVIKSTWDYHARLAEFIAWLRRAGELTTVANPPPLIEWNTDKRYLRELGNAGLPVIPTVWVEPDSAGEAVREAVARGWEEVVAKPAVDLGAERLVKTDTLGLREALRGIDAASLVQPYFHSLGGEGELSLVYFDGDLSHAIRKRPASGDFRVQEHHGGRFEREEPSGEAVAIGKRAWALASSRPGPAPLYGRVDLVRDPDGLLCLIELELIEPAFYLHVVGPEETARAADAIATRVRETERA